MIESLINMIKEEQLKYIEKASNLCNETKCCINNNTENNEGNENINKKKMIKSVFKLTIEYLENKKEINKNVLDDLELIESKDISNNSIYEYVFKPKTIFGESYFHIWSKYYTTDIDFLKDSQLFFDSLIVLPTDNENYVDPNELFTNIKSTWDNIINDGDFREKYNYIDVAMFDKLNHSAIFLQLLSMYNLMSPILSLITPLILAIIPFFILKMQNIQISLSTYFVSLKKIIATHPIGNIFSLTELHNVPWDKRIYIIMTIVFYFIQVYQNIVSCYRFYKNMFIIHNNIFLLRDYFKHSIDKMDNIIQLTNHLITFKQFNKELKQNRDKLEKMYLTLNTINPFKLSFSKLCNIGTIMKINYQLFVDSSLKECIDYSFGFNGYYEHIHNLKELIDQQYINKCTFLVSKKETSTDCENDTDSVKSSSSKKSNSSHVSNNSKKSINSEKTNKKQNKNITSFQNIYYPPLMNNNPVKNNVILDKNIVITGPNAAGKTTIIKSLLFNIILVQQTGFGFFTSATLTPFDYLHSYLNIPDTSGRDSLFQAESRRCKEILDSLESEKDKTHFCIFDELYSGTNPYEAVASAYGYIDYLTSLENVKLMLTTHYVDLCNKLKDHCNIDNMHMTINTKEDNDVEYLYKLENGISNVKGGIKVLCDLNYPDSIVKTTKKILQDL